MCLVGIHQTSDSNPCQQLLCNQDKSCLGCCFALPFLSLFCLHWRRFVRKVNVQVPFRAARDVHSVLVCCLAHFSCTYWHQPCLVLLEMWHMNLKLQQRAACHHCLIHVANKILRRNISDKHWTQQVVLVIHKRTTINGYCDISHVNIPLSRRGWVSSLSGFQAQLIRRW